MARLLALLHSAAQQKVQLVVFPELTLTTFFPRHLIRSTNELDSNFQGSGSDVTTAPDTRALFEKAVECGIDIVVGYAERCPSATTSSSTMTTTTTQRGYNTSIYFSASRNAVLAKYRKVHLPGTVEPSADPDAMHQLEKRYFFPGDLGFEAFRAPGLLPDVIKKGQEEKKKQEPVVSSSTTSSDGGAVDADANAEAEESGVTDPAIHGLGDPVLGMLICNDRRWPECWRSYALQGCELLLCGYNTAANNAALIGRPTPAAGTAQQEAEADADAEAEAEAAAQEALFHSRLVQQASSYQNSLFSISAARCGRDDDNDAHALIGGSAIVDPQGHVVAEAKTTGDELVAAEIDLGECMRGRRKTFDFARHRRVEHYWRIGAQTGVVEPPLLE